MLYKIAFVLVFWCFRLRALIQRIPLFGSMNGGDLTLGTITNVLNYASNLAGSERNQHELSLS